jgi:hypothetical protein
MRHSKRFSVAVFFSGLLAAGSAFAQAIQLTPPIPSTTICQLIESIINGLMMLGAPVASIMVLWGAFQMLFAADDAEKFSGGRRTILYAVIGYGIILVSRAIIYIIMDVLGGSVTWCS